MIIFGIIIVMSAEDGDSSSACFFLVLFMFASCAFGMLIQREIQDETEPHVVVEPAPATVTITEKEYILLLQDENYTEVKEEGGN
jgi:5-enolpyruvylshikimate-3-phosphate synthase